MTKSTNIFLIGPMGAGKTSVGRHLSRLSGFDFYDSDHEAQARTGVSISWIFEVEGEAGFRKREAAIIDELTRMNNIILSTGGGAIVTESNRKLLKERGFVVCLTVDLELQLQRTRRERGHRPLIDVPDPKARLMELNSERQPLYESLADKIYKTNKQTPKRVAEKIYRDYLKSTEN